MHTIFAADIGGTNSRFGHFRADAEDRLTLISSRWLRTSAADSFARLLDMLPANNFSFLPQEADIVGIAIAGPVTEGVRSTPPLIPWGIDLSHASEDFGFKRSFLINDFVAQAFSCISPIGKAAQVILEGSADPQSAMAVIGAGTGLGKAALIPDGRGGYHIAPSEGAHACFPFVSETECAFQYFLLRAYKTSCVTYNHVVSGPGLSSIHQFLTGTQLEPEQVAEEFYRNPQTLSWMARFYGRACRDYSLETLSLGGLYITGGIAARNPEIVLHEAFHDEFLNSPAMNHILSRMPVRLIRNQESGLWGVATKALQEMAIN